MAKKPKKPRLRAGGAKSRPAPAIPRVASNIDLTNEKDRAMVRRAVTYWPKRWGLTDDLKEQFTEDLQIASTAARAVIESSVAKNGTLVADPLDAAKVLASVVKTAVMMEGQNQKDEHHEDDKKNPTLHVHVRAVKVVKGVDDDKV